MNGDVDKGRGPDIGGDTGRSGYSQTPIPDPTVLTTQALYREVSALRELIEQRIAALAQQLEQQFDLVERQRVEQKSDTKDAVDAALSAAKEAVKEQTTASERATTKSETAINKLVEQQGYTFKADVTALIRQLDELKDRISVVDRKVEGIGERRTGAKEDRSGLYATITVVVTVVLAAMTVAGVLIANSGP